MTLGVAEASTVGGSVGVIDKLGDIVGDIVGVAEGPIDTLGNDVDGDPDGADVEGMPEGTSEGMSDGIPEGPSDGASEGDIVGASVFSMHSSKLPTSDASTSKTLPSGTVALGSQKSNMAPTSTFEQTKEKLIPPSAHIIMLHISHWIPSTITSHKVQENSSFSSVVQLVLAITIVSLRPFS